MNTEVKAEGRRQKAEGLKANDELPQGWAIATLKDLGNYINGRAFNSDLAPRKIDMEISG